MVGLSNDDVSLCPRRLLAAKIAFSPYWINKRQLVTKSRFISRKTCMEDYK